MKVQGVSVSRRTVAKYRQELGISHREGRKAW
jgi:DNA-directed RNA polymerase specialized sigma54-like protein